MRMSAKWDEPLQLPSCLILPVMLRETVGIFRLQMKRPRVRVVNSNGTAASHRVRGLLL